MTGLILLDKPQGISSFAAVKKVSRIFGEKRAGHTGTLDPMATGVLPVLLGRSTRLCGMLIEADKRYEADILLGRVTDTGDVTGNVISECEANVSEADILKIIPDFTGTITQTPPMYSAIKQNGVRMYELARKGGSAVLPSRQIEIKQFLPLSFDGRILKADIICSKGTYIRSLASDMGETLGCGATLNALRRTATGGFDISQCVSLEALESDPRAFIRDAGECVAHYKRIEVTDNQRIRFLHGGDLFTERVSADAELSEGDGCRVYDRSGTLLGIGDVKGGSVAVRCIIYEGEI